MNGWVVDHIFSFSSPAMIDSQLVMSVVLLVDQSMVGEGERRRRWERCTINNPIKTHQHTGKHNRSERSLLEGTLWEGTPCGSPCTLCGSPCALSYQFTIIFLSKSNQTYYQTSCQHPIKIRSTNRIISKCYQHPIKHTITNPIKTHQHPGKHPGGYTLGGYPLW